MTEEPIRILAPSKVIPTLKRELSRRNFMAFSAAAASVATLTACTPGGGTQPGAGLVASGGPLEANLNIYSWGDYDDPGVVQAFTDKLGPKVTFGSYGSNEEMISKLIAAKGTSGYDIVVPTGVFVPQLAKHGLVVELNHDLLPNLKYMDPAFLKQEWDPENKYSICKAWGTTGFVYDKNIITRELTTWNDFLDAAQNEASGKTSVLDDPAELTGMYFWANGIDWNTTKKADLDAAEAYLVNKLAPHIAAFDSYPGGVAIPEGTQVLMQVWNGDARLGIMNGGEPERWAWRLGAPATELWMDNWSIAMGAKNPEAAHAFINYTMVPETQLTQLDYIGYHTGAAGVEKAAEAEGLEMLDMVFFTPEQLATMKNGALNENQDRVVAIMTAMKAAAGA
ncbi:MAG: spermidine/putrescine ABC transporter substrate-binding protein [Terrimesophilobacter sp.]